MRVVLKVVVTGLLLAACTEDTSVRGQDHDHGQGPGQHTHSAPAVFDSDSSEFDEELDVIQDWITTCMFADGFDYYPNGPTDPADSESFAGSLKRCVTDSYERASEEIGIENGVEGKPPEELLELRNRVRADLRVVEAEQTWVTCMNQDGVDVTDMDGLVDARTQIRALEVSDAEKAERTRELDQVSERCGAPFFEVFNAVEAEIEDKP